MSLTISGGIIPLSQGLISGGIEFSMDLTTVNMYIMYLDILKQLSKSHEALTHLQFQHGLCQALTWRWEGTNKVGVSHLPWLPKIHCPRYTLLRRECVICGIRCQHFCYKCEWKWLCIDKGCFELKQLVFN
jgi:hypothetical protein